MATPTEIRRRGRWSLILGTLVAALMVAAVAYADDITNDLPGTVKVMALNVGGGTGSTELTVVPQNGDGKNGCNLTGGTTLVVSVSSNSASVATVSPTSLTFTSCGDVKTLTVTPQGEGSANVSLAQTSNTTAGTFNLAPAAFRVDVAPPPNTAPNVSVTGVEHGATYAKGSVPSAGCSVEDLEDGNSTFAASLSAITGTYASDGLGNQTATCSYTDGGGLTETVTATYSIHDPSAPSIGSTLNPAAPDGNNGWYVSNVSLTWNVSEPESPNSLSKTGCIDQNITADQADTSYSCSASSAGGSAGPVSVSIKRDATAPTIGGSASPGPNGNGWNNTNVTVSFTCGDNLSGVASCGPNQTLSSDGAGQSATGTAVDNAGNNATATVSGINVDKTAPVVSVTGVANGATYTLGSVPAAGCSTSDATSGVATNASLSSSGGPVGSVTATCSGALDNAGNPGSASATYNVIYDWNGFFSPVENPSAWNSAKAGQSIPVKFSLAGDQGLNIFASAYPKIFSVMCPGTGVTPDPIEEYVTDTANSKLIYDALAGQYVYVWKTEKAWATKCFRLDVRLNDDTTHSAYFKFTK